MRSTLRQNIFWLTYYDIVAIGPIFKCSHYLLLYICMIIFLLSFFCGGMHYFIDHGSKIFIKEKTKGFYSAYLIICYVRPK